MHRNASPKLPSGKRQASGALTDAALHWAVPTESKPRAIQAAPGQVAWHVKQAGPHMAEFFDTPPARRVDWAPLAAQHWLRQFASTWCSCRMRMIGLGLEPGQTYRDWTIARD